MISNLVKAYMVKIVETDTLEKIIYYILSSLLQGPRF